MDRVLLEEEQGGRLAVYRQTGALAGTGGHGRAFKPFRVKPSGPARSTSASCCGGGSNRACRLPRGRCLSRGQTRTQHGAQGALYRPSSPLEHMRVDLYCPHVSVSELFLHGPDIHAPLEQVRCEGMSQRVAAGGFLIRLDGNTYCHPHSFGAFGYLRARAWGKKTVPNPSYVSRSNNVPRFSRCRCRGTISSSGKVTTRSLPPLPSRTKIARCGKSKSLTRSRTLSSSRSSEPY